MNEEHVVIVGGAIIGSFCAWSLRNQGFDGKITVIEKDASYQFCSTALSAACIRTLCATPLNINKGFCGVEFLRDVKKHFGPETEISYVEDGYSTTRRLEPPDSVTIYDNSKCLDDGN